MVAGSTPAQADQTAGATRTEGSAALDSDKLKGDPGDSNQDGVCVVSDRGKIVVPAFDADNIIATEKVAEAKAEIAWAERAHRAL